MRRFIITINQKEKSSSYLEELTKVQLSSYEKELKMGKIQKIAEKGLKQLLTLKIEGEF